MDTPLSTTATPDVPAAAHRVHRRASAIARSRWFGVAVVATILANSILLAVETDRSVTSRHPTLLGVFHIALTVAFAAELLTRLLSYGRAWRQFFADGWTRFDLAIFVAALLPAIGPLAAVARLARVLRVARMVSVSPKLRLIIATMARSIPSLGHIGLLLGLLLFVYGVVGVHLFRDIDPTHWGDLGSAILTLFQILTLEGWVELQRTSMAVEPWAWVFYGSYVLIAVFVVVNLFIAVVLSNLDQARRDISDDVEPTMSDLLAEVRALRAELGGSTAVRGQQSSDDPS